MAPKLSIVITAYNEERYIGKLLEDILNSDFKDFEVIIVDNNSHDGTAQAVQPYLHDPRFRLVDCVMQGVSQARNYGAEQALGYYLLFFDADVHINRAYLGDSVDEMEQRKLDIANHYQKPNDGMLIDEIFYWALNNLLTRPMQYFIPSAPGSGGIMATKRIHEEIGGFSLERSSKSEDIDYQKRAARIGTFRMLDFAVTYISMRRFDKEGRIMTWFKMATLYITDILNINPGRISDDFYEFGKFE